MAFLAPALATLRTEINTRWPNRPQQHDGWLGDAAHRARKSDHNPDDEGMVHAIDITVTGRLAGEMRAAILASTIGDDRVHYVIHQGSIWSRTYGWKKRAYHGANPHNEHIHVSCRQDAASERSTRPWLAGGSGGGASGGGKPRVEIVARDVRTTASTGAVTLSARRVAAFARAAGIIPRLTEAGLLNPRNAPARRAEIMRYIVLCIQARHRLTRDGVFGAKTGAALARYGYVTR